MLANSTGISYTLKDYIAQYHSRKLNEFVIHLLHEGSEPQHFWDLLSFSSTLQSHPSVDAIKKDGGSQASEDGHEEIDSLLDDINSMVVNLSTSSVPNINELGLGSNRTTSLQRNHFKMLKDSPLSQSCQANLQFAGTDNGTLKPSANNIGTEVKDAQPKRERWSFKVDPATYEWLTVPAGMTLY